MAATKAAAPKKAGAAARAEKNGKLDLDFHGVKLTLPSKLPNSFSLRFARIAALEERGEMVAQHIYGLLVPTYVSEAKYDELVAAIDEVDEDVGLGDLLVEIIGAYGAGAGESEASASS